MLYTKLPMLKTRIIRVKMLVFDINAEKKNVIFLISFNL